MEASVGCYMPLVRSSVKLYPIVVQNETINCGVRLLLPGRAIGIQLALHSSFVRPIAHQTLLPGCQLSYATEVKPANGMGVGTDTCAITVAKTDCAIPIPS